MDSKELIQLPLDIIYELLSYLPIGYMDITFEVLRPNVLLEERRQIIDKVLDINTYLSQLTKHPAALLHIMRQTDTLLSGSRAVNYFVPGSTSTSSDWDFYSNSGMDQLSAFVNLTSIIGFKWKHYNRPYDESGIVKDFLAYTCKVTHKGVSHTVQLIAAQRISPYSCVLRFDLTFCQCFISGFFAASLYHKYTMNKQAFKFKYGTQKRAQKYRERGVNIIEAKYKYNDGYAFNEGESTTGKVLIQEQDKATISTFLKTNEYRYLLDNQTCAIFFDKYTNVSLWHMSKEHICKMLPMIRWYNTNYPETSEEICFLPIIVSNRRINSRYDNVGFQLCSPTLHPIYDNFNVPLIFNNIVNYNIALRPLIRYLVHNTRIQALILTRKQETEVEPFNSSGNRYALEQFRQLMLGS